ncbi:uncharacterized protein LOC120354053 isoform X1 [Nilaparvata lugens]|uniref:uncharacterized protein LOC120354053 isoform X1 n=2 Tax=Nilaparvata lugens TaxID=108931 RepID=UPI00193E6332|nr:uncharacterized protein LOC120354053 isoform X1 [Nilaparvata lugens]
MVVLENLDELSRAQEPPVAAAPQTIIPQLPGHRSTMKLLPKRFINIHQWLSPLSAKNLKESVVSVALLLERSFCDRE